jgi:fructose-bisphosphate aldolase class II
MFIKPHNIVSLPFLLETAQKNGFAVGAFNPHYTQMIAPLLTAAERLHSPLIVQIAQIELGLYQVSLSSFADSFWRSVAEVKPTVPIGLHLDHAKDPSLIAEAISYGFTSVMVDASAKLLDENISITRRVVQYAHARGVAVEAELGRIADGNTAETENDEDLYTDPREAERFVQETGVDALAVSVGTAHGAYLVRQPKIDLERLKAIRQRIQTNLVLHGGSGTPEEMVKAAIQLPGGGVSKINIATDLELALWAELGCDALQSEPEINSLNQTQIGQCAQAVERAAENKITNFLLSTGWAAAYRDDL